MTSQLARERIEQLAKSYRPKPGETRVLAQDLLKALDTVDGLLEAIKMMRPEARMDQKETACTN